ncbi:alpha/beta hydrolase [Mesorhizobium sp. CAU 1732]|uniref:alpha/beta hydrolase n=1 Tax=Mesorhizobium sp. CAU 1732 TaxID=3140358 RepID=UPI0032605D03
MILLTLAVAGCGGNQSHSLLDVMAAQNASQIAASHSILVTTSRAPASDPAEVFSGQRGDELGFARIEVTVPAIHTTGALEQPRGRARRDAAKHFAASEVGVFPTEGDFAQSLRKRLASTKGRALVFVHGYRTSFDHAVYRMAQIVHDSGYTGTPVLFTWASTGRTVDYIYDNNSATIGRDGLEQTLKLLRANGATRIDIVAHSMGNWATMEALRQIAITDERDIARSLGDVVLAAPDIDVDVFKSQLRRIGKPERPFFVMLSRDDRALQVSSIIAGNRPRVGDFDNDAELAELGVVVVNVSGLSSGDRLNHAKFADNPMLVQLLGDRLDEGDEFGTGEDMVADRINRLTKGLGQTVGTAAEIIITTPLEVISVAVGG